MKSLLLSVFIAITLFAIAVRSNEAEGNATNVTDPLLTAARTAQERVEHMSSEMYTKLADIEREYRLKRRPLVKERAEAIRKIPGFWNKSILNHPSRRNWVTESDIACLNFLDDIEITELDDNYDGHYKITLSFRENPIFRDTQIWRQVPSQHEQQETSGVQWKAKTEPYTLMGFFDGTVTDQGMISEIAHAIRYEVFVNPFPYYEYVEPERSPEMEPVDSGEFASGAENGAEFPQEDSPQQEAGSDFPQEDYPQEGVQDQPGEGSADFSQDQPGEGTADF